MLTVELTEEHFNVAIADALSLYSKYATFPTRYLAVSLKYIPPPQPLPPPPPIPDKEESEEEGSEEGNEEEQSEDKPNPPPKPLPPPPPPHKPDIELAKGYVPHHGVSLKQWRVTVVKGISTIRDRNLAIGHDDMLFGWPLLMNGQFGGLPYFGGTNAFGQNFTGSFITYQAFYEFTSLARRIMGSNPDWQFDRATQRLILIPEPDPRVDDNYALLEVECEPPIDEIYQEEYFRRIVLAKCKIMLGTIRSKFGSVQLLGGGQINTDIGNEGREELKEIIDNIMRDTSIGQGFIIS